MRQETAGRSGWHLHSERRSSRRRLRSSWAWLPALVALASILPGCWVVPLALPPARLHAAVVGYVRQSPNPMFNVRGAGGDFRGSVDVMQLADPQGTRSFDIGAGGLVSVLYDRGQQGTFLMYGPYVDFGVFVGRAPDNPRVRVGLHGSGELLFSNIPGTSGPGAGGRLAILIEIAGEARGSGSDCSSSKGGFACYAAASAGEGGIGIELGTMVRYVGGDLFVMPSLSLVARVPAFAVFTIGLVVPSPNR